MRPTTVATVDSAYGWYFTGPGRPIHSSTLPTTTIAEARKVIDVAFGTTAPDDTCLEIDRQVVTLGQLRALLKDESV